MQQIYRRTFIPKCDFNKVALQLYWDHTSAWVFSWKFAAYFQNTYLQEHLWREGGLLLGKLISSFFVTPQKHFMKAMLVSIQSFDAPQSVKKLKIKLRVSVKKNETRQSSVKIVLVLYSDLSGKSQDSSAFNFDCGLFCNLGDNFNINFTSLNVLEFLDDWLMSARWKHLQNYGF